MQKAVSICELAASSTLVMVTNAGRIYEYKQPAQPGIPGTWNELALPPELDTHDIELSEKLNASGRLPQGYELFKRNDNQLYYWERQEGPEEAITSEQFERQEGAIADARNDWMIRHPQKPPPKPQQPLPEVVR
jgi:hypothetical protein